jgi:hypothetical protein
MSAALAFTAAAVNSTVYDPNIISAANIGSGVQGTVTLTQNGANEVDVEVASRSTIRRSIH